MTFDEKEIMGELFRGYINIIGNPQSQYRIEAANNISDQILNAKAKGILVSELLTDAECRQLLALTEKGMENFTDFIQRFQKYGYDDQSDMMDIVEEQIRIGKWVKENKKELIV